MNTVDRLHQAEAAAREALKFKSHPLDSRVTKALRDLLAALDAARGEAVGGRNTPIEMLVQQYESDGYNFRDLDWVRKAAFRYIRTMKDSQVRCLLYALAQPQPVPVPSAPPAALADAFAIARTAAKMTADACKSATGRHGTINQFVNLVQIAHDAAAQAQQPAAAVPDEVQRDARRWRGVCALYAELLMEEFFGHTFRDCSAEYIAKTFAGYIDDAMLAAERKGE